MSFELLDIVKLEEKFNNIKNNSKIDYKTQNIELIQENLELKKRVEELEEVIYKLSSVLDK